MEVVIKLKFHWIKSGILNSEEKIERRRESSSFQLNPLLWCNNLLISAFYWQRKLTPGPLRLQEERDIKVIRVRNGNFRGEEELEQKTLSSSFSITLCRGYSESSVEKFSSHKVNIYTHSRGFSFSTRGRGMRREAKFCASCKFISRVGTWKFSGSEWNFRNGRVGSFLMFTHKRWLEWVECFEKNCMMRIKVAQVQLLSLLTHWILHTLENDELTCNRRRLSRVLAFPSLKQLGRRKNFSCSYNCKWKSLKSNSSSQQLELNTKDLDRKNFPQNPREWHETCHPLDSEMDTKTQSLLSPNEADKVSR